MTSGEASTSTEGGARCGRCAGALAFDEGARALVCSRCGAVDDTLGDDAAQGAHDARHLLDGAVRRRRAETTAAADAEVRCDGCGASIVFTGTLTASRCAWCGTPLSRVHVHTAADRIPVDAILPFAVDEDAARGAFLRWRRTRWFAPSALTQAMLHRTDDGAGARGFGGAYLPYFVFDAVARARYVGRRGHVEHVPGDVEEPSILGDDARAGIGVGSSFDERGDAVDVAGGPGVRPAGPRRRRARRRERRASETKRRVRWDRWPVVGTFTRTFTGLDVVATTKFPTALLARLGPWPFARAIPFTSAAIPGKSAHTYDVDIADAFAIARARIHAAVHGEATARIGGDVQEVVSLRTSFDALAYRHVLLPVWVLAFRHAGRTYRVVVDGVTGKAVGERPWSAWKLAAAAVVVAAVALAAWWWSRR